MSGRTGLVLAGAGARGAYEAGALSVLLPALEEQGQRPTVLVGTSAGALNAAFLAYRADQAADRATKDLLDLWLRMGRKDVFAYSPLSVLQMALLEFGIGGQPRGAVDTRPLGHTLNEAISDWGQIRDNVDNGHIDALAVVTTAASTGRTVVWVEGGVPGAAGNRKLPELDLKKGIEYRAPVDGFGVDHVLASAAIPIVFPPIEIATGIDTTDWFVDGGLRLNTPIKPAIKLGATRVAIVATDPATHATSLPPHPANLPDVDDLVLHALQAALTDPLIEDMWRLAGINTLLGRDARAGKSPIQYLFVGPSARGLLGQRAGEVAKQLGFSELRAFGWLLGRQGSQYEELLSYFMFDPAFFEAAAELGKRDAHAELDQLRLKDRKLSWRTKPIKV
jgi:NTE family protein